MKILINERLSKHRCKTPEGYLICTDAILARTGKQTYRKNEIFKDSDDETEIEVDRTEDEVFSPQTLASFENKPVTVEHPDEDVNVHNYKEYAVGFVRDVHRGEANGQPVILGNLVITDEQTIQEIENGEHTDLSCGYDCDIADEANPCQRNIRGNHVALCECGRAGIARIVDSVKDETKKKAIARYGEPGSVFHHWQVMSNQEAENLAKQMSIKNPRDMYYVIYDDIMNPSSDFYWVKGKSYTDYAKALRMRDSKCKDFDDTEKNIRVVKDVKYYDPEYDRYVTEDVIKKQYKKMIELGYTKQSYEEFKNENFEKMNDSMKDTNSLPTKVKRDLQKFLNHKSTFIHNKDYDIAEFVKEFERIAKLWAEFPIKVVRESIKGWFKTGDGMMRKDYTFSIEGYDDRFMVSIYAKPDTYETTELNAYFTDSVKDQHPVFTEGFRELNSSEVKEILTKRKNGKSYPELIDEYKTIRSSTLLALITNFDKGYIKLNDSMLDSRMKVANLTHGYAIVPTSRWRKFGLNAEVERFTTNLDEARYIRSSLERNDGISFVIVDVTQRKTTDSMKDLDTTITFKGFNYMLETYKHIPSQIKVLIDKIKAADDLFDHEKDMLLKKAHKYLGDSVNDALIPPTKESINKFESLLRILNVKIDAKGLTIFGRVHYQVRAIMPFDQFVKTLDRIDNEMDKLGIPMTFSANTDGEVCTAGIDLDKQHVKDSQRAQKMQKIVKIVKSIK